MKSWTVIIPFKGSTEAKSRLSTAYKTLPSIPPEIRYRLARAFVLDTVEAVLATGRVGMVMLVSSDPLLQRELPRLAFVADPGTGLNEAINAGIAKTKTLYSPPPIAVLTSDLPSLRSVDLETALDLAEHYPKSVVADHLDTGTTMITGLEGERLTPSFGEASHKQHQRTGHHSLEIPISSTLRQDVDTPSDLYRTLDHGVGAATAAVLEDVDLNYSVGRDALALERNP